MKNIDEAINDHESVWPHWADLTGEPLCWCETTNKYFQLSTPLMQLANEKPNGAICTRAQFSRRARYLSKHGRKS